MILGQIDWIIIIGYMFVALGIGLYFSKRASGNIEEYFVAGRKLPWWIAGTSLVATSFAADTPLAIARIVRVNGLQGNWYWWSLLMAFMLCVFFYARMWNRSKIITDVEFIELRYEGKPATGLRLFHAVYRSSFSNCVTMGWVILAMQKICVEVFGWPKHIAIPVLILIALSYSILSGFWGVVVTDFFQFILAMVGSISLAVIVMIKVGGPTALANQVINVAGEVSSTDGASAICNANQILRFTPDLSAGKLAIFTFIMYIGVQWWAAGEGGGFMAQRLFSTKSEKDSMLAVLWFNFAHFVLRAWPWIIVGLASIIYFPDLADPELAYPKMMTKFLPTGLKGIMVASLLAAFMSTVDTHLNWGTSYLVNDIYKRFINTKASERHYVLISRIMVLFMTLMAGITAWQMKSIYDAWLLISEMMAGTGFVILLRWYWWRINAWSEISAMISSLTICNSFRLIRPLALLCDKLNLSMPADLLHRFEFITDNSYYPVRLFIIIAISTIVWVIVTFKTKPISDEHLKRFYRRVKPGGFWKPIAEKCPEVKIAFTGKLEIIGWFLGVMCIYASLFGIGWILIGEYQQGILALIVSGLCGWLMLRDISKMVW
ncbi:MAG: Na+:solute symporter, partial [Anaerolineaceae bacterium]|nr:Na+:solute symporter [Anaerolineaceae bacterium]